MPPFYIRDSRMANESPRKLPGWSALAAKDATFKLRWGVRSSHEREAQATRDVQLGKLRPIGNLTGALARGGRSRGTPGSRAEAPHNARCFSVLTSRRTGATLRKSAERPIEDRERRGPTSPRCHGGVSGK